MKDSEFIELLNLYLDHEISATDAARVEAEVQQNPARRRVYRDYCRLQKACTLLAKDYVEQATSTRVSQDEKIAIFEPRRSWATGIYLGGLAVAAACVALVLVNRSTEIAPSLGSLNAAVAVHTSAKLPSVVDVKAQESVPVNPGAARAIAQTVTVPAKRSELKPVFTTSPLILNHDAANGSGLLTASENDSTPAQFDWMKTVQLAPMQRSPIEDFSFDPKASLKPAQRTFGPGKIQTQVENAAWQFQR